MSGGPAARLLRATTIVVDEGPFVMAAWPGSQASAVHIGLLRAAKRPYFVADDDLETTAFLHETSLRGLPPPRQAEHGFCVLTLDMVMAWDVVGVLAAITAVLAEAGVPVGALTAFSRDHVLVPRNKLTTALDALRPLCKEVTTRGRH